VGLALILWARSFYRGVDDKFDICYNEDWIGVFVCWMNILQNGYAKGTLIVYELIVIGCVQIVH
jgi:hypothetical protein